MIKYFKYLIFIDNIPESESNRTFPVRVRFGSTEFLKSRFGFGSVRFGWVELSKSEFGFGSVRLNF